MDYISFPAGEYAGYQKRLGEGKIIYTTRVSGEAGKYRHGERYDSPFGRLEVVHLAHYDDIGEHPFYGELSKQQISEIERHIAEAGYDVIGLVGV